MQFTTKDVNGHSVAVGDTVLILDISPEPELEEDQLATFMDLIGTRCAIERIDANGTGWVAVWSPGDNGTQLTLLALAPHQMVRQIT